jgi:hypothetical protein
MKDMKHTKEDLFRLKEYQRESAVRRPKMG